MADIQIGVNQGDTVYYYDQSIGSIVSRDWLFPGGTPTGGTVYGPAIQYNSANSSGYDASLFVTDAAGITGLASKKNIIVVFPEIITAQITASPISTTMSTSVNYQSTGATGTGYASYTWSIPGLGATSGPTLSAISQYYSDWYTVAGTYLGSPGASYVGTSTLSVTSNVGNNANATRNVTFLKYGPAENINYNVSPYDIQGLYYGCNVLNFNSGTIGLGGSNLVLEIDMTGSASGVMWDNAYFHSTAENILYYPNNDDLGSDGGDNFSTLVLKTIFSGSALTVMGASYTPDPKIDIGNYITAGFVHSHLNDSFYITDYPQGNRLTDTKTGNREWSNDAISAYMSNQYYLSTSSKFIENGGFGAGKVPLVKLTSVDYNGVEAGSYKFDGGYGATSHGPCIPSSLFFRDKYGPTGIVVDITIQVITEDAVVYSTNYTVSSSSASGNTPDGYLISAQDTAFGTGTGLVRRLNTHLGTIGSPTTLSAFIGFDEAKYFAAYENGGASNNSAKQYDALKFPGIRFFIKNPNVSGTGTSLDGKIINEVIIGWGPYWTSQVAGNGYFSRDRELGSTYADAGNQSTWNSWLGLKADNKLPSNMPIKAKYIRGWKIGGSV